MQIVGFLTHRLKCFRPNQAEKCPVILLFTVLNEALCTSRPATMACFIEDDELTISIVGVLFIVTCKMVRTQHMGKKNYRTNWLIYNKNFIR